MAGMRSKILQLAAKRSVDNKVFENAFIEGARKATEKMISEHPESFQKYQLQYEKLIIEFRAEIEKQKNIN